MKNFHIGLVVPLDRENVDTDIIIPKQFLKSIKRTGFGNYLFYDIRYNLKSKINKNFIMNHNMYQGASIIMTRKNFGCGSSREHAIWALMQYGFEVIISTSYSDIFFHNTLKNFLLSVILNEWNINDLLYSSKIINYNLIIDLKSQLIFTPFQQAIHFSIDNFSKNRHINGIDDIKITLNQSHLISEFEVQHFKRYQWLCYL